MQMALMPYVNVALSVIGAHGMARHLCIQTIIGNNND